MIPSATSCLPASIASNNRDSADCWAPATSGSTISAAATIVFTARFSRHEFYMDPRIEKLKTPKDCAAFIVNARERNRLDLVKEAYQRTVVLRTDAYGPKSPLERQCVEAIYAYEEVLSARAGRRITASKTWQNAKKLGIFTAVDKAVGRKEDESVYAALVEMGLERFTFEAIVAQHPNEFSFEAVEQSRARVARRQSAQA